MDTESRLHGAPGVGWYHQLHDFMEHLLMRMVGHYGNSSPYEGDAITLCSFDLRDPGIPPHSALVQSKQGTGKEIASVRLSVSA